MCRSPRRMPIGSWATRLRSGSASLALEVPAQGSTAQGHHDVVGGDAEMPRVRSARRRSGTEARSEHAAGREATVERARRHFRGQQRHRPAGEDSKPGGQARHAPRRSETRGAPGVVATANVVSPKRCRCELYAGRRRARGQLVQRGVRASRRSPRTPRRGARRSRDGPSRSASRHPPAVDPPQLPEGAGPVERHRRSRRRDDRARASHLADRRSRGAGPRRFQLGCVLPHRPSSPRPSTDPDGGTARGGGGGR